MESTAANPPARKPRSRFWRWTRRIVIFVVGLVIAIAAGIQILLWTDIPRNIVLQKLQMTLGLRVQAPTVHIGWTGRTTLEHVEISLPLAEQSFLEVPQLEVAHTSIPMIMLTQDVTLKNLAFHHPTLLITQNNAGQWNVAEAIDLITRAGGKKQAQDQPAQAVVLPAVSVDGGIVKVMDRNGRTATIQPLDVQGYPDGPLVWKYQASAQDRLKLTGQVSPGGVWEHDVAFEAKDLSQWLSAWVSNPPDLKTGGTWHGKVDGGNINGRITFDQLAVGTVDVRGPASVQRSESGEVTIWPAAMRVQTSNAFASNVTLKSGAIVLASTSATAKDLSVSVSGGDAKIDGSFSWADQSATLSAMWRDIVLPRGVTSQGSANAKLTTPWPGAPRVDAEITSSGKTSAGSWDSHLTLWGNGRAWNDIDWTADVSRIAWSGKKRVELSNLKMSVLTRPDRITLQSLSVGSAADVNASGEYVMADGTWRFALDAANISIPSLDQPPATLHLHASGSPRRASIDEFAIASGEIEMRGDGVYDANLPKPFSLNLDLAHLPALEGADANAPIRGHVYAKASLSGTLDPLEIGIDQGMLYGSNVFVGKRALGNIAIQTTGQITNQQARIQTTEASILGGKWRVRGEWAGPGTPLELILGVRDQPLAQIGDLIQQPSISGTLDGAWTIEIPAADRMRITARGQSDLRDVVAGGFKAERVLSQSVYENGTLTLDPIQLHHGDGSAVVHVDLPIQKPTHVNLTADVKAWPTTAPSGNATATVWAQTQLAVDLSKKSAIGPVNAQLAFTVKDHDAGTLSIDTNINGRVINVTKIEAAALGGSAHGIAVVPIDQINNSQGSLEWKDLNAGQLVEFVPKVRGLSGKVSGSMELGPTNDPRAIGPLKLTAQINSDDLHFKSIDIGNASLTSYFTSARRFVLDESAIHAAGGDIHLWARTTEHEGGIRSSTLQIDFKNLDLQTLDRAFDTNPKPMPGKLAGSFVLIGSIEDRDTLFGQGSVDVTQSNLVNLGAIRGLYNVMHIGQNDTGTDGTGRADLRLDNNTLTLTRGRYFNRGIQVRALARIENIWNAPDSGITGTVIGSARPLRDIKLPYFADADKIMNALQQSLTTVRIDGTLREYHVAPISFYEAGETVQNLVLGEVQKK